MLVKKQPKYNPTIESGKLQTNRIQDLHAKLNDFIAAKLPVMNKWVLNELYVQGLDKESFDWEFSVYPTNNIFKFTDPDTKEEKQIKLRTTRSKEFGKYRYNMKGIPTIFNNYKDDIIAREQVADIKSMRVSEIDKALVSRIINQGMINDVDWETEINPKIIHDVLCKGDGFGLITSYNQVREVYKWKDVDKDGKFSWEKQTQEIADKRGTFVEYLDPEYVFTEPNTDNPKEFFIGKPYTYSEFIQEFPELEKKVLKKGREKGQINNDFMSNDNIYPTHPFPYKRAEKLIDTYRNYHKRENAKNYYDTGSEETFDVGVVSNPRAWFNNVFTTSGYSSNYSNLWSDEEKIWVWTYYNLSYNPNTNKVGDTCVMFVNDYELYSGAIPHADKESPFVKFSFKPNKGTYWSNSMVDELRPLQDEINEIENIRKNNLSHLMTTNLVVNSKLLKGNIPLQRREINVINV